MKRILAILTVVLVSGCASTSPLPDSGYLAYARGLAGMTYCVDNGLLPPELAALGFAYIHDNFAGYTYDRDRLRQEVLNIKPGSAEEARKYCSRAAVAIAENRNTIHNQNMMERHYEQFLHNTNNSRPVYCNTVGGVVMCN